MQEHLCTDTGLLLFRQLDGQWGFTQGLAAQWVDTRADPLGEGHASTWRMMLIKGASRIKITTRRVRVFLSGSWPFLSFFRDVGQALTPDS